MNDSKAVATARIRFGSWAEFERFLQQDGSARGLFVRAATPPPIGTELSVHFVLPDSSDLILPGRVVHCLSAEEASATDAEPGMGVQFTHMSAEQAQRMQTLLAQATAASKAGPEAVDPVRAAPNPGVNQRVSQPAGRDPRLDQVTAMLDRARLDAAERKLGEVLSENPELTPAKILLLLTQARRARAQFDFELALELYTGVLMLDSTHREALDQMEALNGELAHTKALYERVFGKPRGRSQRPQE